MRYEEIAVSVEGSAKDTKMQMYLLDTPHDKNLKIQKRPMVLICPGGGYEKTSFREGEPLAMHFLSRGYHACVLRYSVAPCRFPVQVLEVGAAVKQIREHAKEWNVDEERIFVQGSSAGGHLAASYGIFWNQEFMASKLKTDSEQLKVRGLLLSYPVITADPRYQHPGSFENLLGEKRSICEDAMSLERQVTHAMPPCFIWHTAKDGTVPVENSLLMAMALRRVKVPVELHIFPEGEHGLSLASPLVERTDGSGIQKECAQWIHLADAWLDSQCRQEEAEVF